MLTRDLLGFAAVQYF
uniref:Uncharacterized protein n=1 Tax=Moniliophthora roreri TaxID=221103 RepID=A0A0W0FBA8_MONRR